MAKVLLNLLLLPLLCLSSSDRIPLHNLVSKRKFDMAYKYSLAGKNCLVTGGTQAPILQFC